MEVFDTQYEFVFDAPRNGHVHLGLLLLVAVPLALIAALFVWKDGVFDR